MMKLSQKPLEITVRVHSVRTNHYDLFHFSLLITESDNKGHKHLKTTLF